MDWKTPAAVFAIGAVLLLLCVQAVCGVYTATAATGHHAVLGGILQRLADRRDERHNPATCHCGRRCGCCAACPCKHTGSLEEDDALPPNGPDNGAKE